MSTHRLTVTNRKKDADTGRTRFTLGTVFDISQTNALPA